MFYVSTGAPHQWKNRKVGGRYDGVDSIKHSPTVDTITRVNTLSKEHVHVIPGTKYRNMKYYNNSPSQRYIGSCV